jgi:hypothetical protein
MQSVPTYPLPNRGFSFGNQKEGSVSMEYATYPSIKSIDNKHDDIKEIISKLGNCPWYAREKIDGANTRIIWNKGADNFEIMSRNIKEIQHKPLRNYLEATFNGDAMMEKFVENVSKSYKQIILFGESVGEKIQENIYKISGYSFVLFDVMIDGQFGSEGCVEWVSQELGIYKPQILYRGTIPWIAADFIARPNPSQFGRLWSTEVEAEGIVLLPEMQLYNRRGERIILKMRRESFALQGV